jgi:hypothetical protein
MNINNLKEGQIIKNYKELCNILNIKVTTSDSKTKQLEELSLYCNYERQGNKYIINKIIDNPTITLNDILKNKNSKYIHLLSNIILEYLYNDPKQLKEIPLFSFLELLGITNTNYKAGNIYKKELSQIHNIQIASIYYFYSNTKNDFRRLIERCLSNLQKRSVLFWSKCIIIVEKFKDEEGHYYTRTRKADKEEAEEILNIQRETLKYMNYNNMFEVMKDKKAMKEFNNILKKELGYNYFLAYDLIIGDRAIKIEYEETKKKEVNKLMVNKTYNMFTTDKFKNFYTDYEQLIDLLIHKDKSIKSIAEKLKDKHTENIENYKAESNKLQAEYEAKKEEISKKYIE